MYTQRLAADAVVILSGAIAARAEYPAGAGCFPKVRRTVFPNQLEERRMKPIVVMSLAASVVVALSACEMFKPENKMSFFVTSAGSGKGADLGGVAGADKRCQDLAESAGAGGKTWHAYLSAAGVNARDRIGRGPWQNAKGVVVASNLDQLHGTNNLNKQTALTEKGDVVNGRGDTPNMHDMLTGSTREGRTIA